LPWAEVRKRIILVLCVFRQWYHHCIDAAAGALPCRNCSGTRIQRDFALKALARSFASQNLPAQKAWLALNLLADRSMPKINGWSYPSDRTMVLV